MNTIHSQEPDTFVFANGTHLYSDGNGRLTVDVSGVRIRTDTIGGSLDVAVLGDSASVRAEIIHRVQRLANIVRQYGRDALADHWLSSVMQETEPPIVSGDARAIHAETLGLCLFVHGVMRTHPNFEII